MGREFEDQCDPRGMGITKGVPVLGRIPRIVPAVALPSPDGLSPNVTRNRCGWR